VVANTAGEKMERRPAAAMTRLARSESAGGSAATLRTKGRLSAPLMRPLRVER
jgi:hypothetical protein